MDGGDHNECRDDDHLLFSAEAREEGAMSFSSCRSSVSLSRSSLRRDKTGEWGGGIHAVEKNGVIDRGGENDSATFLSVGASL
jgi:hypothetical protein